jgi:hypothetical protein
VIPIEASTDSDGKHPIREQRDAGEDIISEVDGFGQTGTLVSPLFDSGFF